MKRYRVRQNVVDCSKRHKRNSCALFNFQCYEFKYKRAETGVNKRALLVHSGKLIVTNTQASILVLHQYNNKNPVV